MHVCLLPRKYALTIISVRERDREADHCHWGVRELEKENWREPGYDPDKFMLDLKHGKCVPSDCIIGSGKEKIQCLN